MFFCFCNQQLLLAGKNSVIYRRVLVYSQNSRLRRRSPRHPEGGRLQGIPSAAAQRPPGVPPPAAVKKYIYIWRAFGDPNGLKYFRRTMRVPNMCLEIGQWEGGFYSGITEPRSTVLVYRLNTWTFLKVHSEHYEYNLEMITCYDQKLGNKLYGL